MIKRDIYHLQVVIVSQVRLTSHRLLSKNGSGPLSYPVLTLRQYLMQRKQQLASFVPAVRIFLPSEDLVFQYIPFLQAALTFATPANLCSYVSPSSLITSHFSLITNVPPRRNHMLHQRMGIPHLVVVPGTDFDEGAVDNAGHGEVGNRGVGRTDNVVRYQLFT